MEDNTLLTIDLLNEIDKSYEEQKEVTILVTTPNGKIESKLMIDKLFKPKKIHDCVKELIEKLEYAKTLIGKEEDKEKEVFKMWLILLLIKHFTSLDVPKEFNKQLAVIEKMIETDIFYQIFAEFDTKEVHRVMDEIERVTRLLEIRLEAYEPLIKEVEEKRIKNE